MRKDDLRHLDAKRIEDVAFVVIDFETVTPRGRPPEPIELGAMRIEPGLRLDGLFAFERFIKPPEGAPITAFDTAQTGIRWDDVRAALDAARVLREFEGCMNDDDYALVAQNARYEAGIVRRFADHCPHLTAMPFIDTVAFAKRCVPGLPNYQLDTVARWLSVALPARGRHRALPDVMLTAAVFLKLVEVGRSSHDLVTVKDLLRIAGISPMSAPAPTQGSLFEL